MLRGIVNFQVTEFFLQFRARGWEVCFALFFETYIGGSLRSWFVLAGQPKKHVLTVKIADVPDPRPPHSLRRWLYQSPLLALRTDLRLSFLFVCLFENRVFMCWYKTRRSLLRLPPFLYTVTTVIFFLVFCRHTASVPITSGTLTGGVQ